MRPILSDAILEWAAVASDLSKAFKDFELIQEPHYAYENPKSPLLAVVKFHGEYATYVWRRQRNLGFGAPIWYWKILLW